MSYTPTEWESTDVVTATRLNALEQAVGDLNMSYTPNVWQNGDILSADKMNALEQAVASGGGGGSSDFSTATVELTYYISDYEFDNCPACWDDGAYSGTPEIANAYLESTSDTFTVPLYKGTCVWRPSLFEFDEISVTGNITDLGGVLIITGDGTITITNGE